MHAEHDIVIIGGGLVGASLAIALAPAGLNVAMVEASPAGAMPPVFDERNLSCAEATVNGLQGLGVWQHLCAPTGAIQRIHISRVGDFGQVRFDAEDYDRNAFGRVVVAKDLGDALEASLVTAGVTRYRPAKFLGTRLEAESRQIDIESDGQRQTLTCRLLIGADGTSSAVRDALAIQADTFDYGQDLFVCRMRSNKAPDGTAWERLGPEGPTAVLPRGDRHFGVVHGVSRSYADAVSALDEAEYVARIQSVFGWRAGRFLSAGTRSRYPVRRVVAAALHAPRAVLVGNAAQTIHPVGAQGFNLGFRDALTLVECVNAHRDELDSPAMLSAYAAARAEDRQETIRMSDGLARVTAMESPLLRPFRSVALAALKTQWLQSRVVGGAMGYRGRVPDICRATGANL
jgi:2-octaprenyl-6-methoxyphenol hydroxylase